MAKLPFYMYIWNHDSCNIIPLYDNLMLLAFRPKTLSEHRGLSILYDVPSRLNVEL